MGRFVEVEDAPAELGVGTGMGAKEGTVRRPRSALEAERMTPDDNDLDMDEVEGDGEEEDIVANAAFSLQRMRSHSVA